MLSTWRNVNTCLSHVVFLKKVSSNWQYMTMKSKSSRSEVFLLKCVLKICSKLLCNFLEIKLRHGCSPVNLLHIFRTPFTKNTSGWLLLEIIKNDVKSDMDYSHLVAFIIFIIYLTLTPCFYFGLLARLLRTMLLLRKLKNRLLGWNHVVFSKKNWDQDSWVWSILFFSWHL